MELLSFVLGIAFVVVIAIAIVAVYALVKVGKLEDHVRELDRREASIYQVMNSQVEELHRRVDETHSVLERRIEDFERDIYSQLDSRLDKLQTKLNNQK